MIKTCPVCNRNFDALVINAVYCNPTCRKKAGREKEKEKQSAFYQPPKSTDDRVLWTLTRPTLDEVHAWADLLERFVRLAKVERGVMIYGTCPDGWQDSPYVMLTEQFGASPRCWALTTDIPLAPSAPKVPVSVHLNAGDRKVAEAQMSEEDREIERRVMAEE